MVAAVITTLYPHQDLPLPQLPYNVSINTLISVFMAIMKTAMLVIVTEGLSQLKWGWFRKRRPLQHLARYDAASRGPWASLKLLWTLRGRGPTASVGAIVTIVSLAAEPFAQQLIHYYDCQNPIPNANATIPRTNMYDNLGQHQSADGSILTPGLQSAIDGDVFNPRSAQVPFGCPTGNCIFESNYSTLAFCTTCFDLTQSLKITEQNITFLRQSSYENNTSSTANDTLLVINTTIPSGLYTSYTGDPGYLDDTIFVMSSAGSGAVEIILGATGGHQSWATLGCNIEVQKSSWGCKGSGAASRSLELCVRTYTASVEGGQLEERLLSTSAELQSSYGNDARDDTVVNYVTVDVSCLNGSQRDELIGLGYHVTPGALWLPYNVPLSEWDDTLVPDAEERTSSNLNASARLVVPPHCIYEVYQVVLPSISDYLRSYFSGAIIPDGEQFTGPAQLEAIYNSSYLNFASVNSTFHSVADAMTVHIRQSGVSKYNANRPALGVVLQNETCVHVRWPWLAFPAALAVLTLLFFLAILIQDSADQVHPRLSPCFSLHSTERRLISTFN